MTHLDDVQLIDALEGEPATSAHAASCDACAARVADLRTALAVAREDAVPEPSPLFWTHFASRVHAAIEAAPVERAGWLRMPRTAWIGAAAAAALVLALWITPVNESAPASGAHAVADRAEDSADLPTPDLDDDIEADEAWAVMRTLAEDLDYDTAREAGALPRAGAIERAALELTDSERAELARIIEEEMKRTDS